ncbi:lysis system i-spanin subunit Rz [Pseudomonas taiwanensis]|uniref:lysis system i-spanin subunit Rz n=1 Tax=Pseudomonas taiwanensis TaxID=470150 RepID=UPI0028DDF9D4|nr:lysis system i-spanin subunit Rz [Pseudomonas taiwanensis]MDT8921730.1 lysis system i-spanin subunit Rz [Pseudomonas taiwanensis]
MNGWGGRLIALFVLALVCALGARAAWVWQANTYRKQLAEQADEYGRQLAEKDRLHGREREEAAAAALAQLAEQQNARRALEARLQEQTKTHWKEMNDAQQAQARLRDRLATADLRLSVLVDAGTLAAKGCDGGVREATSTTGVVHGTLRAQLDPAHARRIIAITDEGDRGLIALKACQAYVREVSK